ncbi:MAG: ABC transporter permease subunit [Alphaproteobacteria bacterium]|jgi:glycine betaine/proline transport system permease protein|nr:ABC transporter permease subunit [Alphaproteobacteria bacterium]
MEEFRIPLGDWIEAGVDYIRENFTPLLDGISAAIDLVAESVESSLEFLPYWLLIILLVALGFWRVGWKFALFTLLALGLVVGLDLWDETVSTLALVLSATFVALVIGIPIGIAMAKSDTVETIIRPILDLMQTLPAFVYLIPAAMFFGLGKVPGTIATVIFAMPPVVRLTNLGIRHVDREHIEAGLAFGCTGRQLLFKVQLPLAMPSIMAGVNQTIMLALSMVVIASMIGAGGLGNTVLTGIQRLDVGLGFEGGLGVVVLAIILDRITQSFGTPTKGGGGLFASLRSLFHRVTPTDQETAQPASDQGSGTPRQA